MAVPGRFQAGTAAANPSTQVEISVTCRNLRDTDVFSKSDPMCVLFQKDLRTGKYFEVARSEVIRDNLNPDFARKFVMSYFFEESQKLKFDIYDVDSPSTHLSQHDFLGSVELTLGEIVGSPGSKIEKPLMGLRGPSQNNGRIILRAEELSTCKEKVTMQFKASNLDKKDWFGKSDPFLIFHRANEDNSYTVVHRTEVIKNTLNPTWQPFTITVRQLCNGDYDRSIRVECFDWNRDGRHEIIGEFSTNMRELSKGPSAQSQFEVINPKKKSHKNSGQVAMLHVKIETEHTFLDYVKGGMQMNFTVAIDFTASNGNPQNPQSLHYINPYNLNQYSAAITSVGDIIQDYDTDKLFPALGFGARMSDGSVSHEFPLNFNPSYPLCEGVPGVMQAYYNALQRVELYGPTNFAPIINHVARYAAAKRDGSEYFVLLIITDGIICDMPQTTEAIVRAASLPMSIIIVGVGNADFEPMNILDGDSVRLSYKGQYAERDIVQFVPMRQFLVGGAQGQPVQTCQGALAKEVLAEIPDQIISYMKKYGIQPRMPPPYSEAPPPYRS